MFSEPEHEYAANRQQFLSSHALADFGECPAYYRRKQMGLVPEPDVRAFTLGTVTHHLVLEGHDAFDERYVVGGPINEKTGKSYGPTTKAFREYAEEVEASGKKVVSDDIYNEAVSLANRVKHHTEAARLLSRGEPEQVVRLHADKGANGLKGINRQGRIDWFRRDEGIIDLKTCDNVRYFKHDARRFGYARQLAFYRSLVRDELGITVPVWVIAVEKCDRQRVAVYQYDPDRLTIEEAENDALVNELRQCVATDVWPTRTEQVQKLEE